MAYLQFTTKELEQEGISCDYKLNQTLQNSIVVDDLVIDMEQGTYTFPKDLTQRQLGFLFQQGFPLPQARTNIGLLFFLSKLDFSRLPEQRKCHIIQHIMMDPHGKDLYVDFDEFARAIKLSHTEWMEETYQRLIEEKENGKAIWDAVCRLPWTGSKKLLFAYRYLSGMKF